MQTEIVRTDKWGRARSYENRGRPVKVQNRLGEWVRTSGKTREEVAALLECSRSHLDRLCRIDLSDPDVPRPSLDLAFRIEKVTEIPASYWVYRSK